LTFVLLICVLLVSGCHSPIRDSAPKSSNEIVVQGLGQSCIDQALPQIQNYFNASASASDVTQATACIVGSLDTFDKHVRGANPNYFTSEELRTFLQVYFSDPNEKSRFNISSTLMLETMRMKQVVLGGDIDHITHGEIQQIRVVLNTLRDEMIKLNPHLRVGFMISAAGDPTVQPAQVEAAIAQFASSFQVISTLLSHAQVPYTNDNLLAFLKEVAKLYDSNTGWQGPRWLADHMSTFDAVKSFFLRPPGNSISPNEWPSLLLTASRLHGLWIRYHYLLQPHKFRTTGSGLSSLIDTFNQFMDIVQIGIEMKPGKVIEYKQINDLIVELYHLNMINLPIQQSTMVDLVNPIVKKLYSPAVGGVHPVPLGITLPILQMMRDDFMNWAEMQQIYDRRTADLTPWQKTHLNLSQFRKIWKNVSATHLAAAQDIEVIINRRLPLSYNERVIYFDRNPAHLPMTQEAFTSLNWKRFFIALVLRGYGADGAKAKETGLSPKEFHEFYSELYQLALELRILDPRFPNVGDSIFQESHIFFFTSDGKPRLTYSEGIDLISFALSGGEISGRAYRAMRSKCHELQPDVYNLPMLEVGCYRRELRNNFAEYFKYMPGIAKISDSLNQQDWSEFLIALESTARVHGYSQLPMESADLDKMSAIFQYVESLFLRFDKDGSGTLSVEESMKMYPLLRDVLVEVSGLTDESDLVALYTYILKNGEPPAKDDLWSAGDFLIWKHLTSWKYEVNRVQVIKILGQIAKAKK
jgi:hypothetical protein